MIDLRSGGRFFDRFVRDLLAQAPRELSGDRPALDGYAPEEVEAARIAWAGRIVDEHRSVVTFSEVLRMLADAEAPFDALVTMHRLIGDELRHVKMCAEVATWLGGIDDLVIDLEGLGLPPAPGVSPAARAYEAVVRELCVAETESVRVLRAYRDATRDPAIREVLQVILCDEARHAAAGDALAARLAAAVPASELAEVRSRLPETMERDIAELRATYLDSARGGPGRELGASLFAHEVCAA